MYSAAGCFSPNHNCKQSGTRKTYYKFLQYNLGTHISTMLRCVNFFLYDLSALNCCKQSALGYNYTGALLVFFFFLYFMLLLAVIFVDVLVFHVGHVILTDHTF
jgi:hypothetical protein